jgi:hypothetical protein
MSGLYKIELRPFLLSLYLSTTAKLIVILAKKKFMSVILAIVTHRTEVVTYKLIHSYELCNL